jgi:vitamin B12 transporter
MLSLSSISMAEDSDVETNLEAVQVKGSDHLNRLSLSQQFFTRQDFIGKFQNISELLQVISGVQVRRSSSGNSPKISIRGSTHKQITFIIDGQIINSAQSGGFNINLIPLQQIQSVEVIQSGNTGIVQAIGGVISINTISTNNKSYVTLTAGSFSHKEIGASLMGKVAGNVILSVNQSTNNGSYKYPVPSPFNDPQDEGRIEKIKNNKYEKQSILFKWNTDSDSDSYLNIKSQYIETDKDIPNYQMNASENKTVLEEKKWSHNIGLRWKINNHLSSNTQLGLSELDEIYEDPNGDLSYVPTSNMYTTENRYFSEKIIFINGLSSYLLSINSNVENYLENKTLVPDSEKCIEGFSLCDSIAEQNTSAIALTYSRDGPISDISINLSNTWLTRRQDNRVGISSLNKNTNKYSSWGIAYQRYSWFLADIKFDINKGIRLPSLYELFGDRGLLKGNPNIRPERSVNSSLELNFHEVDFNTVSINIASSIYFKKISDVIVPIYSGSVGSFSNTSSANVIGWEANILLQKNNLSLLFQGSIQDSMTESIVKSFNNKKLVGIFHEKFTSSLNWNIDTAASLTLTHRIESGLYRDMANINASIRNDTTNLKISHTLENNSYNVVINNLLNNEYLNQYNKPAIDRSIFLNFQHQF